MARVGDPAGSEAFLGDTGTTTARFTLDSRTHVALVMERSQTPRWLRLDAVAPAPPYKVPDLVGPLDVLPITGSGQA
ncbi:MAG TPA: hypothetical protein VGR09_09760 [Gemmatimonadales bacterium]|nr:hypothetical protein [Gemmatimonadales bacterium]